MARLKWDGLRSTDGRYEINTLTAADGTVEYFFGKCPLLVTKEHRDEVLQRDEDGNAAKDEHGNVITSEVVWHEVVQDDVPRGSDELGEMKRIAQSIEDGSWRDLAAERRLELDEQVNERRQAAQDATLDEIVKRVVARLDEREG